MGIDPVGRFKRRVAGSRVLLSGDAAGFVDSFRDGWPMPSVPSSLLQK